MFRLLALDKNTLCPASQQMRTAYPVPARQIGMPRDTARCGALVCAQVRPRLKHRRRALRFRPHARESLATSIEAA